MKASDLMIKALEREGVRYIFGVPGEENIDLLESIRTSSIELILTRHEQGAGFMAATYGRLTGQPGVCLSTLGPGATNLVTPAAYAQLGAMPMLMITGQKPIKKSKQGRFQIIDVVDLMQPVTKFARQIVDGNMIAPLVREAMRLAIEERPGAVHLELPEDVAREDTDGEILDPVGSLRPNASERAIDEAISMIEQARHPLLLIGAGANRKNTSRVLTEFVERTGIPFVNTQMGKGVIDERSPHFIGTAALSADDFVHDAIEQADLIINVGHDVIEKPPFFMRSGGSQVIHVNFQAAEVDEVYFPQLNVVGDIDSTMERLASGIQDRSRWDFECFDRIREHLETRLARYFSDTRFPMLPQRLVHQLRERLDENAIVALDNGVYKIWFARNYKAYRRNTLLLDNALASMGAGLPSAMMAKMLNPERQVVAVCGDGGFMMNSQELETAVRLKLDLTVIVLNDGAYGMIEWKQTDLGFERFGLQYGNPDFVRYAESYGARGFRPESDQDFGRILSTCLDTPGVKLIDLPVDYSLNHPILNELIKSQDGHLAREC
ncbi:acetolactate synthase large subunit [Wenzhouxiangella marina]|uniref:Thiamine pyrophosphate-requiring enzyme n=1 Tax=Wenzhouxiangella marina TaxID=1579979 RepID=A0A0K0XVL9_9GAMM|nr:acetolactate synthase large subunit [Wenzhouxiangella marina]AKS41718.1 Thiamine pyrophosphate-requiring enzyme [Wenzhouxiangella marina]MBB6086520.1 acetolactate synthase-1/2/3 large subunit [Wenzhouxiangella marina]